MLRHGRAGVPMEVMGLMLGEFVDDYTVRVVDVFAMPQSGTGVSVEAVDPVFQQKMMEMLRQTGRYETENMKNTHDHGTKISWLMRRHFCCEELIDQRQWLAGITLTRASAAGSPPSTSIPSNPSKR